MLTSRVLLLIAPSRSIQRGHVDGAQDSGSASLIRSKAVGGLTPVIRRQSLFISFPCVQLSFVEEFGVVVAKITEQLMMACGRGRSTATHRLMPNAAWSVGILISVLEDTGGRKL